jgi:hypothetical protein
VQAVVVALREFRIKVVILPDAVEIELAVVDDLRVRENLPVVLVYAVCKFIQ